MCDKLEKKSGKGFYICSKLKKVVINRYNELSKIVPKLKKKNIISEIKNLTELSDRSIRNILKNGCNSPKRTKNFKKRYDFKNSDYDKIDDIISDFNKNKVFPSINDIYKESKYQNNNPLSFKKCARTTFYRIINRMGYKYSRTNQLIRNDLINNIDIKRKRIKYLIEKRRLEKINPGSLFVYIDETFVHKNYVKCKILRPLNNSKKRRLKMSIGKGTRYSIIHAGSEDGFVDGAEQIFINNEINSDKFEDWLQNKLLPHLPPNSVVIYDNASTHSRQYNKPPTQSENKNSIKNWLILNKIKFNNNAKKCDLLKLVKENVYSKQFTVDDIIRKAGHIPLRLPPYHCELNPIELIWAQLKKIISKHNFNNNSIEFSKLISNAFKKIDSNYWRKCIGHVVKIESNFFINDKIIYNEILNEHNYCSNFIPN
jgi:transposase